MDNFLETGLQDRQTPRCMGYADDIEAVSGGSPTSENKDETDGEDIHCLLCLGPASPLIVPSGTAIRLTAQPIKRPPPLKLRPPDGSRFQIMNFEVGH